MRLIACALMCVTLHCQAELEPLRFSIADSWAMPMAQIENDQPTQGIMLDIMLSLARHVGQPAEFIVLARARLQNALRHGEVDIRCFVAQSWIADTADDYIWSLPLLELRDVLVSPRNGMEPFNPHALAQQPIGTVLGYIYPSLESMFDAGQLQRNDVRSQEQVLHMLRAGRFDYAVSNQLTLDWFNRHLKPEQHLHAVAVLQEHALGCLIRNDPKLPIQTILGALTQMKNSGEIEQIILRYTSPADFATQPSD